MATSEEGQLVPTITSDEYMAMRAKNPGWREFDPRCGTVELDMKFLRDLISFRRITNDPPFKHNGSFYAYTNAYQGERTVEPEFDFRKVFAFFHNEPIIEQSLKKRLSLMFKNGWTIVGTKKKIVDYVNKRLTEICAVGGQTVDLFFRELAENLYKYSNVFLYRKRNEEFSSGPTKRVGRTKIYPIASYQIISPMVVKPKVSPKGEILRWEQYDISSNYRKVQEYAPKDLAHMRVHTESGFIFGKPLALSVIPDVEALRRIEENLQMLIAQHLFPLYHYKVGTEERPAAYYPDGTNEVDVVRDMVQSLPTQGVVFSPERHEIKDVSNKTVMDVEPYLEYFKQRVYLGLGVSALDLGESGTANRATATTLSQSLKDAIETDQQMFSALFKIHILKDILLEVPYTINLWDAFQDIELRFSTIDVDEKIKIENHTMTLYQAGMLTHNEARDVLDLEDLTEEQIMSETQFGLKARLEAHLKTLGPPRAEAGGGSKGGDVFSPGGTFSKGMTRSRPENQFGKSLGPKRLTNSNEADSNQTTEQDSLNTHTTEVDSGEVE